MILAGGRGERGGGATQKYELCVSSKHGNVKLLVITILGGRFGIN